MSPSPAPRPASAPPARGIFPPAGRLIGLLDVDGAGARDVALGLDSRAVVAVMDVRVEGAWQAALDQLEEEFGRCSEWSTPPACATAKTLLMAT